ncbi:MAG: UDP-N-acetylmuramoyl-L-alanyl-D-glutamate--2,6-diaminopimelate ligase [Candidatus Wildermuthbacteria bacterium]|nr:UDP-N-acetylmuramoyl-L-alanyl-D-glutamate--2,6-diaminopimelate ligase [Candidatus Wildermuthbacteria bacterium]
MKKFLRKHTPSFLVSLYHLAWAFLSALRYGFPGYGMTVIGVTGTNGKSTTVDMLSRILLAGGKKTASLSSIRFQIGKREWRNTMKMTMPGRFVIQKFLRQAKKEGCGFVVLEVTSEGILQHRHRFIPFYGAVFTNLSPEHIERHGSFENYRKAKGALFKAARGFHAVNGDDEHASFFLGFQARKKIVYSAKKEGEASIRAADIVAGQNGAAFIADGVKVSLRLLGEFNVYNALAAIAAARELGVSLETARQALEGVSKVPGRMEEVISSPIRVIVDYAFTPAALKQVYQSLKTVSHSRSGQAIRKLICVLGGTGGGRDAWKRPVLGAIASEWCDHIIVTNEDPYEEDPQKIIDEVADGTGGKAIKILDRREAIASALDIATPGDTVVITGKGSEDSIAVAGGKKISWDDRVVAREEFEKRKTGRG